MRSDVRRHESSSLGDSNPCTPSSCCPTGEGGEVSFGRSGFVWDGLVMDERIDELEASSRGEQCQASSSEG